MALTRANVETILVRRASGILDAVGFAITITGTNADLNDPIGWAIRQLGLTVADVTNVVDSDLTSVGASDYDALFDLAELRLMQNLLGNLDEVDITLGPHSERLSQLGDRIEKRIAALTEKVQLEHGYGLGELTAGVITMDFMEKDE